MVMPDETTSKGPPEECADCGTTLELIVLSTSAYYVGTHCSCGPYSRETGYYPTKALAEEALADIKAGGDDHRRTSIRPLPTS